MTLESAYRKWKVKHRVYKGDEKLSKVPPGLWTFSSSQTSKSNDLLKQKSQKANAVSLEVNGASMEQDLLGREKVEHAGKASESLGCTSPPSLDKLRVQAFRTVPDLTFLQRSRSSGRLQYSPALTSEVSFAHERSGKKHSAVKHVTIIFVCRKASYWFSFCKLQRALQSQVTRDMYTLLKFTSMLFRYESLFHNIESLLFHFHICTFSTDIHISGIGERFFLLGPLFWHFIIKENLGTWKALNFIRIDY